MALTGNQKAYQYALSGACRSGATRSGYTSARVFINFGGGFFPDGPRTDPFAPGVLYDSVTIQDQLDERRNTCTFSVWQQSTALGTAIVITIGSKAATARRLFAGYVLQQEQTYEGKPRNIVYHVSCVDWSWRLDTQYVSVRYTGLSASDIAARLLAWAPAGFTATAIAPGLAVIDEITFTNEPLSTCYTRLAKRAGAYWYIDYFKGLHFFGAADPTADANPLALTPTHPTLARITKTDDLSQMITRVVVEGGGANALTTIPPGSTSVPVETAAWYEAAGGWVVSGPQRISYTGIQGTGDTGSLVGPGVTPVAPLTGAVVTGAGMESGVHQYAYTWVTAGGETKPSPLVAITVAPSTAPVAAPSVFENTAPGQITPGATYRYVYTYSEGAAYADRHVGETLPSPVSAPAVTTIGSFRIRVVASVNPAHIRYVLYRTAANSAGPYRFIGTGIPGAPGTSFDSYDYYPDSALAENAPTVGAGGGNRVALSGISIGPGTVTARRVYRTAADAAQLKLQQTIANNTATDGVTDATPDASLGANAPTTDTSALSQPSGSVLPGATAIIVASAAWASSTGGWAIIGNGAQVIQYLGIAGNSIAGIPVTGTGSITAAIGYNSTITAAPALVGIPAAGAGAIQYPIKQGDPVNLWIIVEDAAAIALLASYTGDSGIQEEYLQDRRLSAVECRARARALLALRNTPDLAVAYTVRDVNTRAGATITIALPAPTNINATLKIQQVTIHGLSHLPGHLPTFDVQASSARYTFEDLLRQANALTP